MPQMSPLGWVWVVLEVIMGYLLFLVFCYSIVVKEVSVNFSMKGFKVIFWEW
uniref:ATP synthase F0 subunit 8 n=1 Tax=Heterometrus longimanus TaxID=1719223 RepID=A0A0U2NAG0_9SCOR|nr:ATP synthase F0 subunit 8 [Heterometrus longimanus]